MLYDLKKTVCCLAAGMVFLFALPSLAEAADRYWVGGTGNWSDATNHWAATSGGAPNPSFTPTSSDNVIFDTNSSTANAAYTVTVNAAATCLDLTMNGPGAGNDVTWAGASALAIAGSMNLAGGSADIIRTYTGAITFGATTTGKTITFNGVSLASALTFSGAGGSWTLQDALTTTGTFRAAAGTLDTNGQNLTTGAVTVTATSTLVLTLGASNWQATGWTGTASALLTFTPGTSTITLSNTGTTTFAGGGLTYNNVVITDYAAASVGALTGINTFNNLSFVGVDNVNCTQTIAANQTITGTLTISGFSAARRMYVRSSVTGTARTLTAANVSITNADFTDITAAGAASPFSGTSLADCQGNTNITTTAPVTRYWRNTTGDGNWSDTGYWSASSGGATGASVPLCHDTAIIDANSGGSAFTSRNDTLNAAADVTVNNANATFIPGSGVTPIFYGSFTLTSTAAFSPANTITFAGRGTHTITSGGRTWPASVTFNAQAGTYTFQDVFATATSARTLTVSSGTVDFNNLDHSMGLLAANNALAGSTLRLGSGTTTLTGTGNVLNMGANIAIEAGTSTIRISNTSNTALTIIGAGKDYNNIWFNRGASTASNTISGSNTFAQFRDTGTAAHSLLFTAGTTTSVADWSVSGTAGNLITINSTSTATHNLVKIGGGTVSADYLNIQHSVASPSSTWYAGTNSVDNQSVATAGSGWTFTAAPPVCTATVTGSWNTGSNWSNCSGAGGVPAAAENVVIAAGVTITLDVDTPAIGSLAIDGTLDTSASGYQIAARNVSINNGGTLTANSSDITLSGTASILFALDAGGTFTTGTSTVIMDPDAARTLTYGTISFNNLTLAPTLSAARTYTFGTGAVTVNGDLTSDPNGGGTARALTVNLGTGGLTVAGAFTLGGNNSGTTILDTTTSNRALTFNTVTINSGSTLTSRGSNVNITGTTGTLITNTGTWTAKTTPSVTTLSGNGDATVSSAGLTFFSLTSSGTGTKTLGANTTVSSYFSITNGTFALSTFTLTLSGTNGAPFIPPSGGGVFDAGTGTVSYSGNYALGNTTIETSINYYNLYLNSNGETFNPNGDINGDAAGLLTINYGTLDTTASNYDINFGRMSLANRTTVILTPNDSVIMLNGTGTVFTAGALSIVSSSTSVIEITDTSNTAVTFSGGGGTYNYVWFDRGASTASNTISGSNTFTRLRDTGTAAHSMLFTAGTTTAVNTWDVSGTAGNLITINSTSTATHTLSKLGGGVVGADYLNIQHSVATPSSTWYAGTNSVDNQSVATAGSGWTFTAAPSVCTATTTGSWNTGGNWTNCTGAGGVPAVDENVIIGTGVTITLDVDTPELGSLAIDGTLYTSASSYQVNAKSLSVNDGGTLTANGSTIVLSKTSGVLFSMGASATFNAGTSTVMMNSDAAVTLVSGNVSFNDLTLSPTLTASRTYTFGTGTIAVNGDLDIDPDGGGAARTLTINLGDPLTIAGNFSLGGHNSGTTLLDTTSSNYALTFPAVTINSGSTLTTRSSNVIITGTSGTLIDNTGTWTAKTGGTTTLSGNGDATLSSAALTFSGLTLSGTGTKTLGAVTTAIGTVAFNNGSLDIGSGMTHPFGSFTSSAATARVLTLNDSTINLTANGAAWTITSTNFTLNAGTSTIRYVNTTNNANTFTGGGLTYNNVWFDRGASTSNITIAGSNTFADFRDTGAAAHALLFTAGTTNTFSTFTVSGTPGNLITINSTTTATHNLVKSGGGTIYCDYLDIQHSAASPANTWYAGFSSINNQAVATAGSGWIFSGPFNALLIGGD